MLEQVENGDGKVVIGRQQPRAPGDDAVPVMVGVAGEGDVESVLQADQPLHRIGRGRIHADLAVPIHGHEAEGGIDHLVDDGQVQPVALGDRPPVMDAGAAERIDAQAELRAADDVHVDHVAEVGDVGVEVIVPVRGRTRAAPSRKGFALTPCSAASRNSLAFASIQPVTAPVGRAAVGRVVFEAAVVGRIVRGRDDDAVGQPGLAPAVVGQNRVGDRRGSACIRPLARA